LPAQTWLRNTQILCGPGHRPQCGNRQKIPQPTIRLAYLARILGERFRFHVCIVGMTPRPAGYRITNPPSTNNTCPVIKPLQSDARNNTGPAISAGLAIRRSGVAAIRDSRNDSWVSPLESVGYTNPGATQFTRIPN